MNEELIRQAVADTVHCENYPSEGGFRTGQEDAAEAIRLYHARAVAPLVEAAQQILLHAGIADAAPEDIDGEDHEREASLRKALAPFQQEVVQ